jgi:class 3 adenylate cyclase
MVEGSETGYALTRSGRHIAYRAVGTGPAELLFVPPWTSTVELDFEDPYLGPELQRLASIGRLVSYDKYGTGMSDPVGPGETPTLEERVDELLAVLDAASLQRPTVFTGADGAAVALTCAALYPDRLKALCLYAPFARAIQGPDYPIGAPAESVELLVQLVGETWGTAQLAPSAPSLADDRHFLAWLGHYQRRSASPSAAQRFLRMAADTDVRHLLPMIRVPTVVVHRSGDQLVPISLGRYVADHIPAARFVELPGTDHFWAVGDSDSVIDIVEELATGHQPMLRTDRVLATVLFTDVVDSTRHAAQLGDRRWRELLTAHDASVRRQIARFDGHHVRGTGDGFVAIFDGPGRAIRCACSARASVRPLGLDITAGLHTGEVEVRGDDIAGIAVHIAARVVALARPGEILVSAAVPPLLIGAPFAFHARGEHDLKGVPGTWNIFAVDG